LRVSASSAASGSPPPELVPEVLRAELAAEPRSISAAASATLGDARIDSISARTRASGISAAGERAGQVAGRGRRVAIDRALAAQPVEHVLEADVGLGAWSTAWRWCPPARRPRRSFAGAATTALVNGFQSRRGLSITAAGMVWVTMRSITFTIVRCLISRVGVGVVGLELVAQVPVADEPLARRKVALAVVGQHVVHPQVVAGDVRVGAASTALAAAASAPGTRASKRPVSRSSAHCRRL
jgi:hypothetical protein